MSKHTSPASAQSLPKATKHPDVALFALVDECIAAAKVRDETGDAFDKAEERHRNCATPPVIIRTERDRQLGLFVGNRVGEPYDRKDIPVLRALVRACSFIGRATRIEDIEAWERAHKILNALRDLSEEDAREGMESGLTDATRRYHAASDAYEDLAVRLLKMPARTIDGVIAKARLFRRDFSEDVDADLGEKLRIMGAERETVAISLACDLMMLADKEAAQ